MQYLHPASPMFFLQEYRLYTLQPHPIRTIQNYSLWKRKESTPCSIIQTRSIISGGVQKSTSCSCIQTILSLGVRNLHFARASSQTSSRRTESTPWSSRWRVPSPGIQIRLNLLPYHNEAFFYGVHNCVNRGPVKCTSNHHQNHGHLFPPRPDPLTMHVITAGLNNQTWGLLRDITRYFWYSPWIYTSYSFALFMLIAGTDGKPD